MRNVYHIFFLLLGLTAKSQGYYYPPNQGNAWDTLSPQSLNWCSENVDSLYLFLEANQTKAFVLLKGGKIVLERYFNGFEADDSWYWASAGKTMSATLVGLAQEQGYLSIQDSSSAYLGSGWTSLAPAQEKDITIWHQLTMTSGLDDGVPQPGCMEDSCLQYLAPAGQRWAYHNAPYTLLDSVVYQATGNNMNQWFQNTLKTPLGMDGVFLPVSGANVFFSTARSMARFGLFLLSEGAWNGTQLMQDTGYFHDMIRPSQALNRSYGYLFWLNGQSSYMIPQVQFAFPGWMNPNAPADMYAGLGKNAQVLNVVPSQDLVFVRQGDAPTGASGAVSLSFNDVVWQYINRLPCTTGLENHGTTSPLAWPNPMQDRIQVAYPEGNYRLLDMFGRLVMEGNAAAFDLSALPKGTYLLECAHANGYARQVMVK